MKKILVLKTEGEAMRMRSFLESQNIPFVFKSFGDAAYSSVFQNQNGWGMLEAPEEYEDIIKKVYNSEVVLPEDTEEVGITQTLNSKGTVSGKYWMVIIFLGILSVTFGWLYYDTNRKYQGILDAELTYSEWSSTGEVLVSRWKKNNQLAAVNIDRDYNYSFEAVETYNTSGRHVSTWYDLNKNGMLDQEIVYSGKDTIRTVSYDHNEDGLIDETTVHLPGKFVLGIRDEDQNITYDEIILWDANNNPVKRYTVEEFLALLRNKEEK